MNQTSLNNGYVFSNDFSIFYVRGNLVGHEADKVANKDQVTFTFFDNTKARAGVNQKRSTCKC